MDSVLTEPSMLPSFSPFITISSYIICTSSLKYPDRKISESHIQSPYTKHIGVFVGRHFFLNSITVKIIQIFPSPYGNSKIVYNFLLKLLGSLTMSQILGRGTCGNSKLYVYVINDNTCEAFCSRMSATDIRCRMHTPRLCETKTHKKPRTPTH